MPIGGAFPTAIAPVTTVAPAADGSNVAAHPDMATLSDKEWVVRFRPYQPGSGVVNYWASTQGLVVDSNSTSFPDTPMDRILSSPWVMRVSAEADGYPGQSAKPSLGDITAINLEVDGSGEWTLADMAGWHWGNRDCDIYVANKGETDFSNFHKVFQGCTSGPPTLDEEKGVFPLRTKVARLDTDFQDDLFEGFGSALEVNGTGTAICDHHCAGLIYNDGAWTLEFRVKRLSDTGNAESRILSKEDHWYVYIDENGTPSDIRFRCINPADSENYSFGWEGADVKDGEWHHVALVIPENHNTTTSPVLCYFDGEVQTLTASSHPAGTIDFTQAINIGGLDTTTSTSWSDIRIDEVRIWRGERTATEIADNYQEPIDAATDGLQWYWRMDEGVGSDAFNETTEQPFDQTIAFMGPSGVEDDVATVGDDLLLNPHSELGQMALEVWFSPHTLPSVLGHDVVIAGKARAYRLLWQSADDKLSFRLWNGTDWTTLAATDSTAITDTHRLYHAVCRLSTAGNMELYLNGSQVGSDTGATGLTTTTYDFTYGANRNTSGTAELFFDGNISWVRLWNSPLTGTMITDELPFKVYGVGEDSRLVGQWLNNEYSGDDCYESSGNSLDATLAGSPPRRVAKFYWSDDTEVMWANTLEGTAELGGDTKPFGLGEVKHAPGVEIDPPNAVWMFHAGNAKALDAVYEDGLVMTAGDRVLDVWVDASTRLPPPVTNDYIYSLDPLVVRFAETPTGVITADFKGDKGGPGGYVQYAGEMARRVATRGDTGLTVITQTDDTAITALDTAYPITLGYYLPSGDQATRADIINQIVDSIFGIWTVTRAGQFRPVAIPDESWTANWSVGDDSIYNAVKGPAGRRVWRLNLRWGRYWNQFDRTDLAGALTEAQKSDLSKEWRTKVYRDTDIQTTDDDSQTLEIDTLIVNGDDAASQAKRRFDIVSGRREIWNAQVRGAIEADVNGLLPMWLHAELGDVMTFAHTKGGASGEYIIIGWEENAASGTMEVVLWGPSA